jgi:hypothetical protein
VSIAFGLRGPSLSVGAGLSGAIESLVVACDLLAAGDADAIVVVAVEDVGDSVRAIWSGAGWPIPAHGALAVLLERTTSAGLTRERLRNCQTAAEAAGGAVEGSEPGWPSFSKALTLSA